MTERPYVLLSCAASLDGYIDDATGQRLVLSNDADLDRIDEVRAGCDAILVGAGTIRRDDPRLLVRSAARRADRVARGRAASPARATITGCGDLDPRARVFTTGATVRLIYCATPGVVKVRERLGDLATVVDAGEPVDLVSVLADLAARGIGRLLVEGGASMHTQFLASGLADELHLVVAPFFVGDGRAPRFVRDGSFPWHAGHRAKVAEVRQIGDVALVRYALSDRCPG